MILMPLDRAARALADWRAAGARRPTRRSRTFLQSLWPEAQQLGVSRATFDAAIRGLEPDLALPDLVIPGRPPRAAARAGGIRADTGGLSQGSQFRALGGAGRKLGARARRDAQGDRAAVRRAANIVLAIWGRETVVRRLQAAARRHPRARDAGLHRPPQGHVPRRIPRRAPNFADGHSARADAQLLGRRDGADAVPAVRILQICGRSRWRRPRRHLEFGAGCARLGGQAAARQRLAAGQDLGLRGARAEEHRLHHRRSRQPHADRRMAAGAAMLRPTDRKPSAADLSETAPRC